MMKFIKIIILLCLFSSCKKTEVSGVVYSKHNIPVSGARVFIEYRRPASKIYEAEGSITTTDGNGYYHLSFKSKNRYRYYVRCLSDSGKVWAIVEKKESNLIDLYLY